MLRPKKHYWLRKQTPKTAAKKKERSAKLSIFYDYHIAQCHKSEESGQIISNPSRMNICHIFYKRTYKSVEDNLDNYVYLTGEEHSALDRLLDILDFETIQNEFPNSWKIICERVKILLPQVKETGKLKIKFQGYLEAII